METCSVCLEDKNDVKDVCGTCRIKLCVNCWFKDCKTFCPICNRQQLNQNYICHLCFSYFTIKNISICSMCNKWMCKSCNDMSYHSCNYLLMTPEETPVMYEPLDVFLRIQKCKIDECDFAIIGKMNLSIGDVFIIKDLDVNYKEVILFIWDTEKNEPLFDRICKYVKMKKFKSDNHCYRGVKTYYPDNRYTFEHIKQLVYKLNDIVICKGCCENMATSKDGYCHTCVKKRFIFRRWKSATFQ